MPSKGGNLQVWKDKELEKKRKAKATIDNAMPKAIGRMIRLISASDPKIAFYAAKFIIEQGVGKAKQQIELEGDVGGMVVAAMFQALSTAHQQLEDTQAALTGGHITEGVYVIDADDGDDGMHYDENDE